MAVNTKEVSGRRNLHFETYDDLLADVNALAEGHFVNVGNWTLAQVCKHLTAALNGCIDGVSFRASWPMRTMGKLLMKKKFLNQTLPAGFQIPDNSKAQFEPEDSLELSEQLADFRQAIERVKTDKSRALHPFFDKLTTAEWDKFNLRHAELHLSFIKPSEQTAQV